MSALTSGDTDVSFRDDTSNAPIGARWKSVQACSSHDVTVEGRDPPRDASLLEWPRRLLNYSEQPLRRLISLDRFDLDDPFKRLGGRTARGLIDALQETLQKSLCSTVS